MKSKAQKKKRTQVPTRKISKRKRQNYKGYKITFKSRQETPSFARRSAFELVLRSVSFFFVAISNSPRERSVVCSIWKLKAPPRVVICGWLALKKRILTVDSLRRRGRIVVNGCPMCLREEESIDHLMLYCKTA